MSDQDKFEPQMTNLTMCRNQTEQARFVDRRVIGRSPCQPAVGRFGPGIQRGLSFWGFVWGAAFFICVLVIGARSIPPYLNNEKIKSALNLLAEENSVMTDSRLTLLRKMKRRLNIDYADEYVNLDSAFSVKNVKGVRHMDINYEVVVPLFYNASLLFDFKNHLEVSRNSNE